jgi:hypothetical protein
MYCCCCVSFGIFHDKNCATLCTCQGPCGVLWSAQFAALVTHLMTICVDRAHSSHYHEMSSDCTVFYIHPFFSALCTHTHGFIYIYKPDTNSNTVLPCARPKHIHITYHSFTILTHIYIYLFIFLVLRANKSSTCSLFPELVPLISQSFSEANFLVQAVKLDPLGLVTSLDTTLSLQCQSQCVSCLDMSRSSAWSDSTTASQVSALSSAHASGKSPQPKVQFGSMRINLVQNARCCWSITKGWRGMPLISTSGSLKGIKRMAARELSKIFWCPACFSHASALL